MINHKTVVPTNFVQTDKKLADIIGREYLLSEAADPNDEEFQEHIEMYLAITKMLMAKMEKEIQVMFTSDDPYSSYEEMVADIDENGVFRVFNGGSHPEYLGTSKTESMENNLMGRAVHDYWGHYGNECDFSFWGEFEKWHHQKKFYPEVCHPYLFTEVVGQTALCHHLPGGFGDPLFVQKPVKAPEKWIRLCYQNCPVDLD